MISSMTGFGKSSVTKDSYIIDAEIRSVNSRFLEVSLRLPQNLQQTEYEIKELVRNKLKRGKVYLTINIEQTGNDESSLKISREKIHSVYKELNDLRKELGIKEKIVLSDLLRIDSIYSRIDNEIPDFLIEGIKESAIKAIDALIEMRKEEGQKLAEDIKKRIDNISSIVTQVENNMRSTIEEYFSKLKERTKQLLNDTNLNEERLITELGLLAEKADITEECVRLKSHLIYFSEIMKKGEDEGRKLNFLCQELNREANTIASKSLDSATIHNAVILKEEIERIREQLQNIE